MDEGQAQIWTSVIRVGDAALSVVAAGRAPGGWPAGAVARVTGCIDGSQDGPPAAGSVVLSPAARDERAYRAMAAAFAADDMVGLLRVDGAGEYRLRSLGEALVAEWGRAESAEEARGFAEADLAGALLVLRMLPRRLPTRPTHDRSAGTAGEVVDLLQARRARGR